MTDTNRVNNNSLESLLESLPQQDDESRESWKSRLIDLGVHFGLSRDKLVRLPTYTVVELLKQAAEKKYGVSLETSTGRDTTSTQDEYRESLHQARSTNYVPITDIDSYSPYDMSDIDPNENQAYVEQDHDLSRYQPDQRFRDDETIVDVSYITSTSNPIDEKFARFRQLVEIGEMAEQSIAINTDVLNRHRSDLDESDVQFFTNHMNEYSENFRLVREEMLDIYNWMVEMEKDKVSTYQSLATQWCDPTGQVAKYLQRRISIIRQHIETIRDVLKINC